VKPELRAKILAYNRIMRQRAQKNADMDILVAALLALPPGQLKKLLTADVLAVVEKYGGTL
jgi:hypothetical protein